MDFQDRFRDRSSLLTKNGPLSILNAPGKPISKSNISHDLPFFIPHGHNIHNISTEFQAQKPLPPNPTNTFLNNSGHIVVARPIYSRHSPRKIRSRMMPHNVLEPVQSASFGKSSRNMETERDISNIRIPSLRAIDKDIESFYAGYKTSRFKEKSLEISRSRKEGDIRPEEYTYTQDTDRIWTERSHDGNENRRLMDYMAKKALRKAAKRGISMEITNTKRVIAEYSQPATVRMRELFAQNEFVEKRNVLPQVEKSHNLDTSAITKGVLSSFREKTTNRSGYLMEHFNKVDSSLEIKRPMTRAVKTRSCEKIRKGADKDQLEGMKESSRGIKEEKNVKLGKMIRMPTMLEREKEIEMELQKITKRVSFREKTDMITNRTLVKQKDMRLSVLKRVNSDNRS